MQRGRDRMLITCFIIGIIMVLNISLNGAHFKNNPDIVVPVVVYMLIAVGLVVLPILIKFKVI